MEVTTLGRAEYFSKQRKPVYDIFSTQTFDQLDNEKDVLREVLSVAIYVIQLVRPQELI